MSELKELKKLYKILEENKDRYMSSDENWLNYIFWTQAIDYEIRHLEHLEKKKDVVGR